MPLKFKPNARARKRFRKLARGAKSVGKTTLKIATALAAVKAVHSGSRAASGALARRRSETVRMSNRQHNAMLQGQIRRMSMEQQAAGVKIIELPDDF